MVSRMRVPVHLKKRTNKGMSNEKTNHRCELNGREGYSMVIVAVAMFTELAVEPVT